ncbi:hypothetical protein CBS101457_000041 [Exobasidium rhododendri]|nr:hypothetical protein CBS101457_000041 [Exobasidium rhododendri]
MTSACDDGGIVGTQPMLVLPKVKIDPQTKKQMTPLSPPKEVDAALLELVHSVQHELNTPLHGMLAHLTDLFSDLKGEIAATGNGQRVSDINALGKQLLSVLEDFRDYASHTLDAKSAEENHEIIPSEEADLGEILDEVAAEVWDSQVKAMQAEKGPDVRIPPPPELILTLDSSLQANKSVVCVDAFKKVARKLIDNAMKFTTSDKDGYVEVSLAPHRVQDIENEQKDHHTKDFLRLSVEDTGSGMTNEFVSDQLFTPFAKADKFKMGCGLSMALCSSLVRKMGGSMQVSSDKDRGTTVIVLIPVVSLPSEDKSPSIQATTPIELVYFHRFDGNGLRRLAGSISSQLATYGNVYTTTRIEEADHIFLPEEVCYGDQNDDLEKLLEKAKKGIKIGVLQAHKDAKIELTAERNGSPPPVYVTRKPFGPQSFSRLISAAVRARSDETPPNESKRLSNSGQQGNNGMGQEEGSKRKASGSQDPLKFNPDLVTTADMSVEILRGVPPAVRMITPLQDDKSKDSSPQPFTVLCVEDNALNMRILTKLVSQCKLEYTMATDGAEAVAQFEKKKPALVLLDITMPKKDGYQACKEMRILEGEEKKGGKKRAHVIAITALGDDYSKKKGLEECGMDEWLTKPLDLTKFKKEIISLKDAYNAQ